MELWLLLILPLGFFTYWIIKRSVTSITRTPVWLLWLVLMMPPLIWSAWGIIVGNTPIPVFLVLGPFLLSPLLYYLLIQWGRRDVPSPAASETLSQTEEPNSTSSNTPPPNLDKKALPVRPITPKEESALRNCFPWGVYYLQKLDYRPQAILCRGKLRTNPETAYKTIEQNVREKFSDRFLVLFQEGLQGNPFFALIPNPNATTQPNDVPEEKLTRPILAFALMAITLFTTSLIGTELAGLSLEEVQTSPAFLLQGLSYGLSVMVILGIHELGHYLAALHYKIRTTLPYFIPLPFFLGTFGAFIQMRSPTPNRKALFDISIAGPLAGFIATLPILLWGLSLSEVVPLDEEAGLLNINAVNPRYSFLLSVISKLALGSQFTAGSAIDLHPMAFAGYIGLIITALNLMPVGQLDGGHIVHAMLGQRTGAIVGQVARLLMLVLAFTQKAYLIWAIILLFMPIVDEPALNDVSELDNKRDLLGVVTLGLLVIILLPVPGTVAQWLGI